MKAHIQASERTATNASTATTVSTATTASSLKSFFYTEAIKLVTIQKAKAHKKILKAQARPNRKQPATKTDIVVDTLKHEELGQGRSKQGLFALLSPAPFSSGCRRGPKRWRAKPSTTGRPNWRRHREELRQRLWRSG